MHRNSFSEDIVDFTIVWKEELEDVTKVLEVAVRKPFSWEEEFERLETLSDVSGCSKQDEAMIFSEGRHRCHHESGGHSQSNNL